ncbi:MAG: DUF2339 domain-containing protein [Candidatus Omnitrophota bacterium]
MNSLFLVAIIWIISIIAVWIIVDQKKNSASCVGEIRNPKDAKEQLDGVYRSLVDLQNKVNNLELAISKLAEPEASPKIANVTEKVVEANVIESDVVSETSQISDLEINFGRNWLNKIGIVVFALGICSLIVYASQYFGHLGPLVKIMLGYLVSFVLFFLGFKLEAKEKLLHFGRVLMGGGWALVYFTTYAMYHFEASRIIQSQVLDLFLLAFVVVGMIAHVLKYKSEEMMSIALLVAYVTATIGQITSFTVMSCILLAILVLFLVYYFQWVRTFVLGVILTYAIHAVWVMPKIMASACQPTFFGMAVFDYSLFMNFLFLTVYGLIFLIGAHIMKTLKDDKLIKTFAVANFGNIALYSVFAYPLILKLFFVQRFAIVLSVGIIYLILALFMKKIGRQKLYVSDVIASILMITFSIPLRFLPTSTLLIWLVEIPFLLFVGLRFKEKIFRYFSYVLTILIGLRLVFSDFIESLANIYFLGITWRWIEFMSLWGFIVMAVCFYLMQREKNNTGLDEKDRIFDQVFSAGSCFYLTVLLISVLRQPWVAFVLSVEGLVLLAASIVLVLRRFRVYAYLVLGISALTFMSNSICVSSNILKWFLVSANVSIFFIAYSVLKYFYSLKRVEAMFNKEESLVFWTGLVLLTHAIFQYMNPQWISLGLGIASVLVVLTGILRRDKIERSGGLLLLVLTLVRVISIDLSGLDIIFKIVTFIVLGALFVGISFVYNRINLEQKIKD